MMLSVSIWLRPGRVPTGVRSSRPPVPVSLQYVLSRPEFMKKKDGVNCPGSPSHAA